MRWCRFGLLAAIAIVAFGCGRQPRLPPPPGGVAIEKRQEGLASWYGRGDGYHGRKTASGERFNRSKLTAAHFSLPFGTKVRVRNQRNGKQVVVRINDRLPVDTLRKGRIIDVSWRAARKLDMVREGIAPVELHVISVPKRD